MKVCRVLLVEDSEDHAALVRLALDSAQTPCDLSHVESSEEALTWLEQAEPNGRLPDLVLVDVNLPVASGHHLLRWMKSDLRLRRIPVVMLTTSQSPLDVDQSYSVHANSYLIKPTSFPELKIMLQKVIDYWGELNARSILERQ